jgi:hypothetical protein
MNLPGSGAARGNTVRHLIAGDPGHVAFGHIGHSHNAAGFPGMAG